MDLEDLRPFEKARVIDAVGRAGISTSSWTGANDQSKCHNWSFGGGKEHSAFCVWWQDLIVTDGKVVYPDKSYETAIRLEAVRTKSFQSRRARAFHQLLQQAATKGIPVQLILVDGVKSDLGPDEESSQVTARALDDAEWYPRILNQDTWEIEIVRATSVANESANAGEVKLDSFQEVESPVELEARLEIEEEAGNDRDSEVSREVKRRADGKCEQCGEAAFQKIGGSLYLETHHVFDFSKGGPDAPWAAMAICANDHRRSHFSAERSAIQAGMTERLAKIYPAKREELLQWLKKLPR